MFVVSAQPGANSRDAVAGVASYGGSPQTNVHEIYFPESTRCQTQHCRSGTALLPYHDKIIIKVYQRYGNQ
jgi:hypothetical protein